MANTKISGLTAATTPVAGTEILPIVQSSTTKQVSIANLTAGRSVSATDYVMTTGNLVPSTAAKGVNFSANTPATGMTSQVLGWYEEGTWTPTQGAGLTVIGAFSSSGTYTRIGNIVFVKGLISAATSITSSAGAVFVGGLPFTAITDAVGGCGNAAYTSFTGLRTLGNTNLYAIVAQAATTSLAFSITYKV